MKRTLLIALSAIALGLVIWIWLRQPAGSPIPVSNEGHIEHPAVAPSRESIPSNGITTAPPTPDANAQSESINEKKKRIADLIRADGQAKNIPLDFYGRVVDQDGNPLHGVRIDLRLRHWNTAYSGSSITVNLETDTKGHFHAVDATGDAFDIESILKAGYELEPNTRRGYRAKGGSADEPVKFKMWRSDIKEALISDAKSFRIVPDGRDYFIDLHNGAIGETGGGDIKASIKYATEVVHGQPYDWSAQITVPTGGLLEETNVNSSMYLAPTNGYESKFQLTQQILGGQSGSIGTRRFFLKLKNGEQYGRIEIQMNAPYNSQVPGRIRISHAINPSGSRILR